MNVESIEEVKVLTSTYQAEYGRSSGCRLTATTKSGSNRFRGSVYDVERNSKWNANSHTNFLNGESEGQDRRARLGLLDRRPVGKPGRGNSCFSSTARVRAADVRQRPSGVSRADGG